MRTLRCRVHLLGFVKNTEQVEPVFVDLYIRHSHKILDALGICVYVCMCACLYMYVSVDVSVDVSDSSLVSLLLYTLATAKVISGQVPACDSAHAWCLYSVVPLGD